MDCPPLFPEPLPAKLPPIEDRLSNLAETLSRFRFRFAGEADLQAGIERALLAKGLPHQREKTLSPSERPDFLLDDGLAIEVKVDGSLALALRQVARYAGHEAVQGILLVGTPPWLTRVPDSIAGKPLRQLRLVGSLL